MIEVALGERIKMVRQKMRLTQEELGEITEVTGAYIGQIERGERTPSIKRLEVIAKRLNVSVDYLLAKDVVDNMNLNLEINSELIGMSENQKKIIVNIIKVLKGIE